MNLIIGIACGVVFALFVTWAIGRIATLKQEIAATRLAAVDVAGKLGHAETQRDALQIHCGELRQLFAVHQTHLLLTDEQIGHIAQAIVSMSATMIQKKEFVN